MECSARLLVLIFGLCAIMSHVQSIQIYGSGNANRPDENIALQLEQLNTEKLRLQDRLQQTAPMQKRKNIQADIKILDERIQQVQATARVSYKDHLQAIEDLKMQLQREKNSQRENFEQEKVQLKTQFQTEMRNLRQKLERAEDERNRAAKNTAAMKQKHQQDIAFREERLKVLTKDADRISKKYADSTEQQHRYQNRMSAERNRLLKDGEEMSEKFSRTRDLLLQILEAILLTGQNTFRPVRFPHLEYVDELRRTMNVIISVTTKTQRKDQLSITKEKLQVLLKKLYDESKLSDSKSCIALERELDTMEMERIPRREQQFARRTAIIEKLKNEDLVDYEEEDITSLQQAIMKVAEMDKALYDIARQRAYLYAISNVTDLIKECS